MTKKNGQNSAPTLLVGTLISAGLRPYESRFPLFVKRWLGFWHLPRNPVVFME